MLARNTEFRLILFSEEIRRSEDLSVVQGIGRRLKAEPTGI